MSINISSEPDDFTGQTNTIVTFAPDESVQFVNVTVVNDDTLESTEMFTAMLTAIPRSMVMIGAAGTATATITDDDSKPQCHPNAIQALSMTSWRLQVSVSQ